MNYPPRRPHRSAQRSTARLASEFHHFARRSSRDLDSPRNQILVRTATRVSNRPDLDHCVIEIIRGLGVADDDFQERVFQRFSVLARPRWIEYFAYVAHSVTSFCLYEALITEPHIQTAFLACRFWKLSIFRSGAASALKRDYDPFLNLTSVSRLSKPAWTFL